MTTSRPIDAGAGHRAGSPAARFSWAVWATLLLVGWGAFSFGAVYEWASLPLFLGCGVVGVVQVVRRRRRQKAPQHRVDRLMVLALFLVAVAIMVQLTPLTKHTIARLSPESDRVLRQYLLTYAALSTSDEATHSLSIEPGATRRALAAFAALSLLLLGLARALAPAEIRALVAGVVIIGVTLAMLGIVQKALWNGSIYGFWTPREGGDPFGPFVNNNHFAGWMLMAVPLGIGYFCSLVARAMSGNRSGWRRRVEWLGSREASITILTGFGVAIMALALVLTFSRSGLLAFLLATAIFGWLVVRHVSGRSRTAIAAGYLAFVVLLATGWTGLDRLASGFSGHDVATLDGRVGAWGDAWHIARRFPLVGTGLNTYGVATLFYQRFDLEQHYAQAHNDYLQIAAEGGLLVGVPAAAAVIALVLTIRRRFTDERSNRSFHWIRAGAVIGLVAIGVQEVFDFSLQMPGNAVLFTVEAAVALSMTGTGGASRPERETCAPA